MGCVCSFHKPNPNARQGDFATRPPVLPRAQAGVKGRKRWPQSPQRPGAKAAPRARRRVLDSKRVLGFTPTMSVLEQGGGIPPCRPAAAPGFLGLYPWQPPGKQRGTGHAKVHRCVWGMQAREAGLPQGTRQSPPRRRGKGEKGHASPNEI